MVEVCFYSTTTPQQEVRSGVAESKLRLNARTEEKMREGTRHSATSPRLERSFSPAIASSMHQPRTHCPHFARLPPMPRQSPFNTTISFWRPERASASYPFPAGLFPVSLEPVACKPWSKAASPSKTSASLSQAPARFCWL